MPITSKSGQRVAVIGAGLAGIAAARRLQGLGIPATVLEARDRVGGRAFTRSHGMPAPFDLGCEWLHSADRNPLVKVGEDLGLTIERSKPDWGSHAGAHFPEADRAAFQQASSAFWDALEQAAQAGGPDRAAVELLEPGGRWNGLIQAISTYYNGCELGAVSVVDLDRYVDTGVNWRVAEGYGTLAVRAARGLDIRLSQPVTAIDQTGPRVRIETASGSLEADFVIVTVPTAVLASEAIEFRPALPAKSAASEALPLGLADKIFFSVAPDADLPVDGHVFGTTSRAETISFDLRPRGASYVEGFVGGAFALELERGGFKAFEAEARAQLGFMLGSGVQKHLSFMTATAWAQDKFAGGSYSHARPGKADAREALSEPDDRIFFAGEACSKDFFSTGHGAWETGIAAANMIVKRIAGRPEPMPEGVV